MANLSDLRMEKPHFTDGSTLWRSRSDNTRMLSSVVDDGIKNEMIPVKMLIAQELSKEDSESRHNSPSLVAKLMGLDAVAPGLRNCYSESPVGYSRLENESLDSAIHRCEEEFGYKDEYEIRQSPDKARGPRGGLLQKGQGRFNEKKMALIRRRFMEAKRVSTDALEILRVLQEPSSLMPTETKRITVLRPCKMALNDRFPDSGGRSERQVLNQGGQRVDESPARPTRIVVLKHRPGRIQDVRAAAPCREDSDFCEERGAKEIAREVTQRIRENLAGLQRDETFISSVFSNGYTGDESCSLNKSEDEFVGNLSDLEVMSPPSTHCWDYVNRYDNSAFSCSSLGRVSLSPESSVSREAKKRLSERWAMMESNGTAGKHEQVQRSQSTLGEMLALCDPKRDQDPRATTSRLTNSYGGDLQPPTSLVRSKSLPVSSSAYGLRLDVEPLDAESRKIDGHTKQTAKSSFRGKFTGLFFRRSKKSSKDNNEKARSQDNACDDSSQYNGSTEIRCSDVHELHRNLWADLNDELGKGLASDQVQWSTPGKSSENQDQPSPVSVLEPSFEEDGYSNRHGKQMAFPFGKSNLIDKSPPIGSIARKLVFDEPCVQPATSEPMKASYVSPADGANEGEWLILIQSLLSESGVENESQLSSNLRRWDSPESPLDSLLREKYLDITTKEALNEANMRQLKSRRQLVFDFVNAALLDMTGLGVDASYWVHDKKIAAMPASGEALADRVWGRMKEVLWRGGIEAEDGEDSGNLVAEMAVRKELEGRGWDDQVKMEIDSIGKDIQGKLLEELVEDFIGYLHR